MTLVHLSRILAGSLAVAALFGPAVGHCQAAKTPKTKMTMHQAEAVALKKYKAGKINGRTVLENEEGKWEYAVMLTVNGKMHEVMVNANSGRIDSEETVTPKEEAAEQKAEAAAKKHGKTSKGAK